MKVNENFAKKPKTRVTASSRKNMRFYASAAAMLALILVPFGLYTALDHANIVLSTLLFVVIAGTMGLTAVIS